MSALPALDLAALDPETIDRAASTTGAFLLHGHGVPIAPALALARAFFDLRTEDKRALALAGAPFRGYSELRGPRDCREQMHFGLDRPPRSGEPPWRALEGPNRWPASLGPGWRAEVVALMARLDQVGRRLLSAATVFPLPAADEPPYALLKLIRYPAGGGLGVAPHCDFSYLTVTVHDGPGLAFRAPSGAWHEIPPTPGALLVVIGELLAWVSRGRWRAAPHRVDNRAPGARLSLPFFVNPSLSTVLDGSVEAAGELEHVHRVLAPGSPDAARLHFGEAEWRRKGEGRWCHRASCLSGP
jgi:isopenicillin N synthase-like dioxygenase